MPNNKKGSTIRAAEKVLKVLFALRGHYIMPITITELAKQVGDSPSQVHRALQTLINEGFAEQRENSTYAPSMAVIQFANANVEEFNRFKSRMQEYQQRSGITQG